MSTGIELITTPDPHFIPGYAGHCPQSSFKSGQTFGHATHELLLDPTIDHAATLPLSNRKFQCEEAKTIANAKLINSRKERTDPVYKQHMLFGYKGVIPDLKNEHGKNFPALASQAIAKHEKHRLQQESISKEFQKNVIVQSGRAEPRDLRDRLVIESKFKYPMVTVRPDCIGVIKDIPTPEPYETPKRYDSSPFFLAHTHPKEYVKSRYAGHVPYRYLHVGASDIPITKHALCDLSENRYLRERTEWAPVTIMKPERPLVVQPTQVYHDEGMIPNYLGHIPGYKYKFGKTFATNTKNTRRLLEESGST